MPLDCTPTATIWAGLDISKEHVDYFVLNRKENPRGRLPRRASALGRLARSWRRLGVTHAVIEATGGFEREVWESLEKAGIAVTLIQPRRVRQFAGACAIEAKTDRIDAELLARFGAALEPAATPLPGPAMSRYRELPRQLNYLVGERARLRTRTHRVRDALVCRSLARVIKSLSTEIEKLEQAVGQALEALPEAGTVSQASPASRWRGEENCLGADGRVARVRAFNGQASGLAGGTSATGSRLRHLQRQALDRCGTTCVAPGPLPGRPLGGANRSAPTCLLSATPGRWKTQTTRAHRCRQTLTRHAQRQGSRRFQLASRSPRLT